MAIRKPEPKELKTCPIGLALLALEPRANPLEMPVESFDPVPAALDIDMCDQASGCPRHHYVCTECGLPLREGCYHP
jgi:hypothetical protein